jgi:hypothetical protein
MIEPVSLHRALLKGGANWVWFAGRTSWITWLAPGKQASGKMQVWPVGHWALLEQLPELTLQLPLQPFGPC